MLHGKAIIELHNTKTHRSERIVHKNLLTNWMGNVLTPRTVKGMNLINGLTRLNTEEPASFWFGGLMMFESALTQNATDYLFPDPADNRMVAHASGESYTGSDKTRGSFNSGMSSITPGTMTQVWDFVNEQGNGTIASLGLCNPRFAKIGNGQTYAPENNASGKIGLAAYQATSISAGEIGAQGVLRQAADTGMLYFTDGFFYSVSIASGTATITKYYWNNKTWNPLRSNIEDMTSPLLSTNAKVAETKTVDLSEAIGTISGGLSCVTNDGHMYIISNSQASNWAVGTTRTLCILDIAAGTYTTQTISNNTGKAIFASVTFNSGGFMEVHKGYMYFCTTDKYYAYINLLDDTDAGIVKAPNGVDNLAIINGFDMNTYLCYFSRIGSLLFFVPDGSCGTGSTYTQLQYIALSPGGSLYSNMFAPVYNLSYNAMPSAAGFNDPDYGILYGIKNRGNFDMYMVPALALTTKNNLDSAVTKTADMTMRVTYTVTDQAE